MRHITLNILFLFILSMPLIGQSSINLLDPSSDPLYKLYGFWELESSLDHAQPSAALESLSGNPRLYVWMEGFNFYPNGYKRPDSDIPASYRNRPQNYGGDYFSYPRRGEDTLINITDTLIIPTKISWNAPKTTIKVVFESQSVAHFKIGDHPFVKFKRLESPTFWDYMINWGLSIYFPENFASSKETKIQEFSEIPNRFIEKHGSFFKPHKGPASLNLSQQSFEQETTIFPGRIIESQYGWDIEKVWRIENFLLVFTGINKYAFPQRPLFILRESEEGLRYAIVNSDMPDFKDKELNLLQSKGNQLVPLEKLPKNAFQKYLTRGIYNFRTVFKPVQLSREGLITLNGTPYKFKRAYKINQKYHSYTTEDKGENQTSNIGNINEFDHVLEFSNGGKTFSVKAKLNTEDPRLFFQGKRTIFLPFLGLQGKKGQSWGNDLYLANKILLSLGLQLLTIVIPFFVLVFFVYRMFIFPYRLKNRLTALQFEGIKSQLNPHFLFNSMASIQSLMNQRKAKEANRYLNELSDLLRYHLDTGAEELVPLSEELSAIEHYCELEKLRSPFDISFEIDERIDPDRLEIPNQLLQPIVENAIKHGLRKVDDPKLRIRVQQLEKSFSILIEDNGPGIGKQEKVGANLPNLRKTHKGLGLVKEKISLLKKRGIKMKLKIEDRQQDLGEMESGTIVKIELPLDI